MYAIELVKYMTETAGELLDTTEGTTEMRTECAAGAAELLHLGTRILRRAQSAQSKIEPVIQEAA